MEKIFKSPFLISLIFLFISGCATTDTLQYIKEGHRYSATGQYDKALESYQKTLQIAPQSIAGVYFVAAAENNIGNVYTEMGQYDEAMKYYGRSLQTAEKLEPSSNKQEVLAANYNNIGNVYYLTDQYEKAIEYTHKAISMNKSLKRNKGIAINLTMLGAIHQKLGQYDKAIQYCEQAMEPAKNPNWSAKIDTPLQTKLIIPNNYLQIGWIYYQKKDYLNSIKNLKDAEKEAEKIRKIIRDEDKLDYQTVVQSIYKLLASNYIKIENVESAFEAIEMGRAKLLSERLNDSKNPMSVASIKQVQEEMDDNMAIIVYANADWKNMAIINITKDSAHAFEISATELLKPKLKNHETAIQEIWESNSGTKFVRKKTVSSQLIGKGNNVLERAVKYFHSLLTDSSLKSERSIQVTPNAKNNISKANREYVSSSHQTEIGRVLYDFLIKPVEGYLKKKEKLIIISTDVLGFLPFEALINENGEYLAANYKIKYAHSMKVLGLIRERKYKNDRKPLLAFGGAIYDDTTYNRDTNMVQNEIELVHLTKEMYKISEDRGSFRNAYNSIGYGTWNNLPGTLDEVENISKIVKSTKLITGEKVTENEVKNLSRNGDLANYKVIHFATHGFVIPALPELSAIVLSQFEKEQGGEDGFLRAGEIANLKMRADFVNLSACETGIGKVYGGEGVVGLIQPFLVAGANSVLASLWQVNDASTAKFMAAVYEFVEREGMEYQDAIAEVKLNFIRGAFGKEYKKPFYWAPFVYYGK